jgi:hypothetical protein
MIDQIPDLDQTNSYIAQQREQYEARRKDKLHRYAREDRMSASNALGAPTRYDEGKPLGSHTKEHLPNDSQYVEPARVAHHLYARPGQRTPWRLISSHLSREEAYEASRNVGMLYPQYGYVAQFAVVPSGYMPDENGEPVLMADWGKGRALARGTEAVGQRLGPWLGNMKQ